MLDILASVIEGAWNVAGEMAPYLLFGFFVAGILSVLVRPEIVERHLGGSSSLSVIKAALFGIPLPLCSCGVIPVTASLRRHGAGRGAATAFLISTPQTGVDSIFVTLSLLGPLFAVFRPLSALAGGLLGGLMVNHFDPGEDASDRTGMPEGSCEACPKDPGKNGGIAAALRYGFTTLPRDIGKPLLAGVLAAGIISAAVPDDFFAGILGGGIGAMLVMMLVGLPVYVCATASVPIAAALIAKGVSFGAALVFLMTGPATNAAAITTVWKVMGRRTCFIYLGATAFTALAAGSVFDTLFPLVEGRGQAGMGWMMPAPVRIAASLLLLALLLRALVRPEGSKGKEPAVREEEGRKLQTVKLSIEGMTCSHCSKSVHRSLSECAGVATVEVDLHRGSATVRGERLDPSRLARAVEALGYRVTAAG